MNLINPLQPGYDTWQPGAPRTAFDPPAGEVKDEFSGSTQAPATKTLPAPPVPTTLMAFDEASPPAPPKPQERSTLDDMYHDVGMYRDKPFDESVRDLLGILERRSIRGSTAKGAQVSANAGPTNWSDSALTIRIKKSPREEALFPDDNAPAYARWYGTMSRQAGIPLDLGQVEVIVNGQTPEEVADRLAYTQAALTGAGIDVPVRSIENFMETRFGEIAEHLPEGERSGFIEGMQSSPLWARKGVGELAARKGDAAVAEFRQSGVPERVLAARDELTALLVGYAEADRIEAMGRTFIADVCALTEAEQMVMADRFGQKYTFAVGAAADGYLSGQGLRPALQEAQAGRTC